MEVIAGEPDFVTSTSESGCTFTFDFSRVYWNSRLHTEHERLVNQFEPGTVVADAMAGVGPFSIPAAKKGTYVLHNDLNPESVKWARENRVRNKVESRLRVSERDAREFIRSAPLEAWTQPFVRSIPMSNTEIRAAARARRHAAAANKGEFNWWFATGHGRRDDFTWGRGSLVPRGPRKPLSQVPQLSKGEIR